MGNEGGGERDGSLASHYDYELTPDRIARYPADRRDQSRLLIVPRGGGSFRHGSFSDLVGLVRTGDLLVVNESRVFPARLLGRKPTGAPAEVLLLRPWVGPYPPARPAHPEELADATATATHWEALVRPGGKLKPGRVVEISDELTVEILDSVPGGGRLVRLDTPLPTVDALRRLGHVPLPPYLEREAEPIDRERYQTVYARSTGSVAAPTAGLHFTEELLGSLARAGVRTAAVTLHVGVGTFRPLDTDDPSEHEMHEEPYSIPPVTADAITATRERGGRVWAVGTTVVRTLEAAATEQGRIRGRSGSTRLFIHPPFDFRVVDGLITNFHLPRSTLLMLVAAFAGYERTMDAYREAIGGEYRFYSYGDAMAVTPRP